MNAAQRAKLPKVARAAVRAADKSGALDRGEFTMASARVDVIKRLGLPAEVGAEASVRKSIKQAVTEALAALGDNDDDEQAEPSPVEEAEDEEEELAPKQKQAPRGSKSAKGSKAKAPSSDDEDEGEDGGDDFAPSSDEEPPRKRARSSTKATSRAVSASSRSRTSTPMKGGSKSRPSLKSVETIEDSDDENPQPVRNARSSERASPARSELSMSSVYDEPPKKRGRGASAEKPKTTAKKGKKDPNEGLSTDEARVADLKRIVVACGVRKQWTKEFADCPTPSSQTTHLLDLLRSLGMKGNPTMGKAKSLKERRELAQELNDVKEFEAERGAERPRRGRAEPDRRTSTSTSGAMAAVMDFLDDDDD